MAVSPAKGSSVGLNTIKDIQRVAAVGVSISAAIKDAIAQRGMTLSEFADKHQLVRTHTSQSIGGRQAPSARLLAALMADFGGSEIEWKVLLHEAGRPRDAHQAVG